MLVVVLCTHLFPQYSSRGNHLDDFLTHFRFYDFYQLLRDTMRHIVETGIIPKGANTGNLRRWYFSQSHYENYALITIIFVIYFSLQKLLLRRLIFQLHQRWMILHLGVLVLFFSIAIVANTLHFTQHDITIIILYPQGNIGRISIAPELSFITFLLLLTVGMLQATLLRPHIYKAWIIFGVYSVIPVFIILADLFSSIANIRYIFLHTPYYLILGIILISGSAVIALSVGLLSGTTKKPKRIEELPTTHNTE